MEALKYPIGRFKSPGSFDPVLLKEFKNDISTLPELISKLANSLSEEQLETTYRPGGWTARQVIHHVADSHMNSYIRYRWTLTEDKPLIKAYNEKLWSELEDAKHAPIELSLNILEAIHAKWTYFLDTLSIEDLEKVFIHPETNKEISLYTATALYAWHGKHHTAHVQLVADQ